MALNAEKLQALPSSTAQRPRLLLELPSHIRVIQVNWTSASPGKEGLLMAVVHGFPVPLPEDILLGGCHIQIAYDEHLQENGTMSTCKWT